ncbi:MAG: hypothetical protein ACP5MH_08515 [Thermoproteus sp.]
MRHELYLNDMYYIAFDLTQYQGTYLVVIKQVGGPGSPAEVAYGNVQGGYIYGYPMEIVQPIYEGQTYTFEIDLYSQNGAFVGSATVNYVEKWCPDVIIDGVQLTPSTPVGGGNVQVAVTLTNNGEESWRYHVSVYSQGGALTKTSQDVTIGAGSTTTVTLTVPVSATYTATTDTMVVDVSCDNGAWHFTRNYQINVMPARPGPFVISAPTVQARLGQPVTFTLSLTNQGSDAQPISLTFSTGSASFNLPSTLPGGTTTNVPVTFTPTMPGVYKVTVTLTYKSPITGQTYQDTGSFTVEVYAELAVNAVDQNGNPVQITPSIAGNNTSVAWLLPGTYTVSVPQTVDLGGGARLVFVGWQGGGTSPSVTVALNGNTQLTAVYKEQYQVVLDLSPALSSQTYWVDAGSSFTPQAPSHVDITQDSRWALEGFQAAGQQIGPGQAVTVTGPLTIKAVWVKEYKITVSCGQVACINGQSQYVQWAQEGSTLSITLAQTVDVNSRTRWVLSGSPTISFTVTGPQTITPNYVEEYYVNFGYAVKTASGISSTTIVTGAWIKSGDAVTIPTNQLEPPGGPGVKYVFSGYLVGNTPISGPQSGQTITVTGPVDVYAVWDKYYYLNVTTPVGTAQGGGWYLADSYATVSVGQTTYGFLVYQRFVKWVASNGSVYTDPTVTIKVDKPLTLTAVWAQDFTQAAILGGGLAAAGMAFWKRDFITRTLSKTFMKTRSETRVELEDVDKTHTWVAREKKESNDDE